MQPEFVTSESLLLDTAERIGRVRAGRVALRVHLSRLTPRFSDPAYGRVAARLFDGLVANYRCQVFTLSNGDIVATGKDMPFGDVDAVAYKLRTLFDADPLVHHDPYGPEDRFCTWYDLETDYDAFLAACADAAANIRPRRPHLPALTPADVDRIVGSLSAAAIKPFIAAQAAVAIAPEGSRLAFQELFVSVAELLPRLAPGTDFARDRWLFQYLCQVLDPYLLEGIEGVSLFGRQLPLNLNLNVATVLSPAFTAFLERFPAAEICVEFQTIDAFADLARFDRACARLHETGHHAMIDSLTPLGLWLLAEADLPIDRFKLLWAADIASPQPDTQRHPANTVKAIGADRIVLAHCDSVTAIDWGLRQGIGTFQGRFVDETLIAGVTHADAGAAR